MTAQRWRLALLLLLAGCPDPHKPRLQFYCKEGRCSPSDVECGSSDCTTQPTAWCAPIGEMRVGPTWLCYPEATSCKKEKRPEWGACRRVKPDELLDR